MAGEFMTFLKQYGVIGLAIAVIIGGKLNAVVSAIVEGLLMPLIGLIPIGGDWQAWGFTVRDQVFKIGPILAAGLDFLVVAWLVFHFSKKVLREETVSKK
jgi:large conductance mechanosensitive channel